ncbi:hypothetical protein FPV67DRAFT_620427 [Lyophyllum atratum]|nr:hypothetical protein FPV67DRAFT_620427 [Lyophyllum atratum]
MATVPQPGSAQQPPPQTDNSPQSLSWEGEKMFNIYIYDYCFKRGFRKTARELMSEADIAPDSTPPINARQGLLFEWWSVFWVLFTAKANGSGPDEAMLYTQHQANQLLQRQATQRLQAPPGQPLQHGQQLPPGMPPQPGPPMNRLANGAPRPGMLGYMGNGSMPNGVGPPPGSMQPGGPTSFSMAGGAPQPNGIPGPPGPPQGGPSAPGQNFQPLLSSQRSSIGGGMQQSMPPQQPPQQQRGPGGPFQSPNMGNSPQNPPGQQPPHSQQQLSQPPMNQLGGPSPHLTHLNRGGMLPPNQGMNPMNPQQGPPGQQGNNAPPPTHYQRSPSRATTPGQGQAGMMHASPSLASRQPPGPGPMMSGGMDNNMNNQIMQIPTSALHQIKVELGLESKELSGLTSQDKQRIVGTFRARQQQQQQQQGKPGGGPPDNAAAGPSNPMMQPPNQQQRNNAQQRNQQQHQPQQRGKRNSTSPGEEHENLPRNESSPPDRKRVRRSPMEQPAVPPMNYPQQQPQQHPQQPGGPQMMATQGGMVMMRAPPNMGMNGGGGQHPGQPPMGGVMNLGGMGMGGQQPMGMSHMGGGSMNPQMGHPSNLTPHMQSQQMQQAREQVMRQHQQAMLPKGPQQQPGGMGNMTGSAGSPSSSDPSFNMGGPLGQGPGGGPGFGPGPNRMGQKNMMPPPSPAMNGPPKDQNSHGPSASNSAKNPNQNPGMPVNHGSPRNPPPGSNNNSGQTPNTNGTGPSTPAPGNPQNPNQGGPGQGPGPGGLQNMAPSPVSILGGPPMNTSSMGGQPSLSADMSGGIFSTDFIQSVASSLDEFDTTLFRPDGDINFERDFGQWFNPDDVTGLDMK